MRENIVLSDRLKAVADMVTVGNRVCDVGCDHAFAAIYLINHKISPYVIAMDLRTGPLTGAGRNIEEYGLSAYIETRLSDGLENYKIKEADSLICAGMGGKLMIDILTGYPEKTASFKELILQPQSELERFRYFLKSYGYTILDENMIEEGGKFYPIIKAVKRHKTLTQGESLNCAWTERMENRYGPVLIKERNPVLRRYINWEIGIYEDILSKLEVQDISKPELGQRYREVSEKLSDCRKVSEIIKE